MGITQSLSSAKPAQPAFAGKPPAVIPEDSASILRRLSFGWLSPLLHVGFSRTLEADDLWVLNEKKHSGRVADEFSFAYDRARLRAQMKHEAKLKATPLLSSAGQANVDATNLANEWALVQALYSCYFWQFWAAGCFQLLAEGISISAPLLMKEFLSYLTSAYLAAHDPDNNPPPPSVQYGLALAIALGFAQFVSTICSSQASQFLLNLNISASSALNANVFRKTLRMSPRARIKHPRGQITNLFSEDSGIVTTAVAVFHNLWVAPIQIAIAVSLLVYMLGVSAWAGVAVLLISFPIQGIIIYLIMSAITGSMAATDKRLRLMQEVLQGVRSIKIYAWENFFEGKIAALRSNELSLLRRFVVGLSYLMALTGVLPVACNTVSFVVYSLTGHSLTPAVVFGALQLFNMIREPLVSIPATLSTVVQSRVSLQRISLFLNAEENAPSFPVDETMSMAVKVDADFSWEDDEEDTKNASPPESGSNVKILNENNDGAVDGSTDNVSSLSGTLTENAKREPFKLTHLALTVPRGSFVVVVGRVGSGKSSLLEALAGEMRKTRGDVILGGKLAYAPQTPWIINATVKENIVFGEELDAKRYEQCIQACALERDIASLSHQDNTEIGERGITLSGGQKARLSLARVAYCHADIVLLDDPLSAVDAHVGSHIIKSCLMDGPLSGRTRILATHALHVLPVADYIYVLDRGAIVEHGTYEELRKDGGALAPLLQEYGSKADGIEKEARDLQDNKDIMSQTADQPLPQAATSLMQEEDQDEGQVSWSVYKEFFAASGSTYYLPFVLLTAIAARCSLLANQWFLAWWSSQAFPSWSQKDYIIVYSSLGVVVGFLFGLSTLTWMLLALRASRNLFTSAIDHVVRSPVTFFDTTPMGRIVSRLSKDVKTLDMGIGFTLSQVVSVILTVITTLGLVVYVFPIVSLGIIPLAILYVGYFNFYRRNSVAIKRLSSTLRSAMFNAYSETLPGLSTVRASRQEARFIRRTDDAIDLHNRATYISQSMSQWLEVRLSLVGNLITLGLGVYAVVKRSDTAPAESALVLTYVLAITSILSATVTAFASVEQNMVSVERILSYTHLPEEGDSMNHLEPPRDWPTEGSIHFQNVDMAYREGLPDVLRDVTFHVKPGEKVGICGRTGAGKSSLLQVLLRMFEIRRGNIVIDGQDTALLKLESLRTQLGVIPQDSIFLGSVRECIDPLNTRTDAELIQILQHSHLVPPAGSVVDEQPKFTLDTSIGQEGASISAGEKQQLALCRVLVKRSKIVILDEATSNVDIETDAKLQQTIRTQLVSSTLLTIAHRLKTIMAYDRVLVMDKGEVAEFDAPLFLFDKGGLFRGLCDEAVITRDDIVRARYAAEQETEALI